jgi:hypothetical protein
MQLLQCSNNPLPLFIQKTAFHLSLLYERVTPGGGSVKSLRDCHTALTELAHTFIQRR